MAPNDRCLRILSNVPAFLNLAKAKIRQRLAVTTSLLLATSSFAQQSSQTTLQPDSPDSSQAAVAANKATVTVPAGTRIALVLTHPILSRVSPVPGAVAPGVWGDGAAAGTRLAGTAVVLRLSPAPVAETAHH